MRALFLALLFLPCIVSRAQSDPDTLDLSNRYSELLEESQGENEEGSLYELLEDLRNNPININTAGTEDLIRIPFISPLIAANIVGFRTHSGKFKSADSLINVTGIDEELLRKIIPFVTVTGDKIKSDFLPDFANTQVLLRSRISNDLQQRRGFSEGIYPGSSGKYYNRIIIKNEKKLQMGFLSEKDPGENSFSDFTSFHLQIKSDGIIRQINAGDFIAEFGNGLTLWSPYRISKGADPLLPSSINGRDISSYTSTDENRFFRGIAIKTAVSDFTLTGFYSNHKIDASIDSATNSITAFPADGYHRTSSEYSKKDIVTELAWGIILNASISEGTSFSLLYNNNRFSREISSNSAFGLKGQRFKYLSAAYRTVIVNLFFTGEFSYDGTAVASINSLNFHLGKHVALTASVRNYPHNFQSLHSSGLGESSNVRDETGIYFGIRYRSPWGTISAYYDIYKFPYPTYSTSLPSSGKDFMLYFITRPANRAEIRIKYKSEDKEIEAAESSHHEIIIQKKQNLRMEFLYSPNRVIDLKSRIEFSIIKSGQADEREKGFLFLQDIRVKPVESLYLQWRMVFFQTDGYDSRLYEFENDLPGVMVNQMLYDSGLKWYILCQYKAFRTLTLGIKYSELLKPKSSHLGSGYNELPGNLENKLSIQIDFNF